METARDRLRKIREYRRLSQESFAKMIGITKQAYGKKERGEIDGFSPEDFEIICKETEIDARWLFGQMKNTPIEMADLRINKVQNEQTEIVSEMFTEYKALKKAYSAQDSITERINSDPELKECVKLLIENRGLVSKVVGYLEIKRFEKGETMDGEHAKGATA